MASTVFRGRPIGMEVNGTMLCITKWQISEKANQQVVTNSCSPGEGPEHQDGTPEDTVTFEGFVKSDQNITTTPLNIRRGQTVEAKLLYRKTNPIFKSATLFITEVTTAADINGNITFSGTALVQGDVVQPVY